MPCSPVTLCRDLRSSGLSSFPVSVATAFRLTSASEFTTTGAIRPAGGRGSQEPNPPGTADIVHGPVHTSRSNHAILVLDSDEKRTGARAFVRWWRILVQQSLSYRLLMRAGVG